MKRYPAAEAGGQGRTEAKRCCRREDDELLTGSAGWWPKPAHAMGCCDRMPVLAQSLDGCDK